MIESIILAGGLGARIQSVIGAYPKAMALVNGRPFLDYLFHYLKGQGVSKLLLSLGYQHQVIEEWVTTRNKDMGMDILANIESEPLGTGGAIRFGLERLVGRDVLVLNGDSFFDLNLQAFYQFHLDSGAETSMALKKMKAFDRYGRVETNAEGRVLAFEEKKYCQEGWINTGVYLIRRQAFLDLFPLRKFSFEKDYLESPSKEKNVFGYQAEGYFIDIGIPQDYARAQTEMKTLFPL